MIAPLLGQRFLVIAIFICAVISLVFILKLAPVDSPAKPVTSLAYKQRMRLLSLLTVVLMAALQVILALWDTRLDDLVVSMSLGILWQTFTLTRWGHAVATMLDYSQGKEGVK